MSDFQIRLLDETQARLAIPALAEVLSDCVEGGASVGFMQPYPPESALPYWSGVADAVAAGDALLMVAEEAGRILGTVQVGVAQMPNQPHRGDLKKLLAEGTRAGEIVVPGSSSDLRAWSLFELLWTPEELVRPDPRAALTLARETVLRGAAAR